MAKWRKMASAPKDGTSIILLIDNVAIEGHWQEGARFIKAQWVVEGVPSHGCGCCSCDNPEPTGWIPLPDAMS